MNAARISHFQAIHQAGGLDVDGFFVAGTAAAAEFSCGCCCVVCGRELVNVYVTTAGPMGGDCLATITGDDTFRALYRRLERLVTTHIPYILIEESDAGDPVVSVKLSKNESPIRARMNPRTIRYATIMLWAARHNIKVKRRKAALAA